MKEVQPLLEFKTPQEFHSWLKKNHSTSDGIWVKFYKKASGVQSLTYAEAMDEVLCFGWIDSQMKGVNETYYAQKFSPRRSKSLWSKINREKVARLIKEGRMQPSGLAEIEKAKEDGRWDAAYDSPTTMVMPEDFLRLLEQNKKAKAFFETLSKTNLYAIGWRLQTAKKPETRERRMQAIVEMLERGEKWH